MEKGMQPTGSPELVRHDTTAIVIERQGKFLLVRRAKMPEKGFWAVPGGHVEAGESARECAGREAREEVGEVRVEKGPFFLFVHDAGLGHRHRAHVFRGTLAGEAQAGTDAEEARWFSLEDMGKVELTHYTKKIFNFILYGDIR